MAKFFEKMMHLVGFGDNYSEDEIIDGQSEEYSNRNTKKERMSKTDTIDSIDSIEHIDGIDGDLDYNGYNIKNFKNSKIVKINTQMKVIIINPETYEEARDICDYIKAKKPVVINFERMDNKTAQRVMDFLSGTCYALNGGIQRVAQNIFVVAPENVDISNNFKEELKTKGVILPWMNSK